MKLTPAQRKLRARLAVLTSHLDGDPVARTAAMQGTSPQHLGYWVAQVRAEHLDLNDAEVVTGRLHVPRGPPRGRTRAESNPTLTRRRK